MISAAFLGVTPLPDANSVFGCEVESVGGLDVEGGVPAVVIADGSGAKHAGCMRVGEDKLPEQVVPELRGPVLGEGNEELLVSGVAAEGGSGRSVERGMVGVEGGC